MKIFYLFFSIVLLQLSSSFAQQNEQEEKKINFNQQGTFHMDNSKYPGALIFQKRINQIEFEHNGGKMWCDLAVFYQKKQLVKAYGNVIFRQGDSITITGSFAEYKGLENFATIRDTVILRNRDMTLEVDTLYVDRNQQKAYYNSFGTIRDSVNILTSERGIYFIAPKKYQFIKQVKITNPKYVLESDRLDYFTRSKNAYMYGPSTITGQKYKMYCERGFYDTQSEKGYGVKNTTIHYNDRIIEGDSLYFNKNQKFASATNHIKVTDTINKGILKGHYAEVFKDKDSVFITKKAVAINLIEKDSMYIHGDTLMITGKPEHRILRAFRGVNIYKKKLSGKCDSLHFDQKSGLIQLITKIPKNTLKRKKVSYYPILWAGENQMTGDSIHLVLDVKKEKLDSLKVFDHAFIIEKDTVAEDNFNQVKGKTLYGKFADNELKTIDINKNSEVIYYSYDEQGELFGIDKTISSRIKIKLKKNKIEQIIFYDAAEGFINPEKKFPKNARKLKGFFYRGAERILNKEDIFDAKDRQIKLVKIKGIPIPEEKEEKKYPPKKSLEHMEHPKAIAPKKTKIKAEKRP